LGLIERGERWASTRTLATVLALFAALLVLALALAPRAEGFIYWVNHGGGGIDRASLDGTGVDRMFVSSDDPGRYWIGPQIAVDSEHIYWHNVDRLSGTGSIARANLDGSGVEPAFIDGVTSFSELAVDAGHVYWTNEGDGTIGRANLDGSGVDQAFIDGIAPSVHGLAVDSNFIYWTTQWAGAGVPATVGRANLDGSGVDPDFITNGPWSYASIGEVAVDANHVYWTQQESPAGSIGRANLDGSGVEPSFIRATSAEQAESTYAWALAVDAAHIYWMRPEPLAVPHGGPSSPGWISRANLDGTPAGYPLGWSKFAFIPEASYWGLTVDARTDTELAAEATAARTQRRGGKRIAVKTKLRAREPITAEVRGKIKVAPAYKLKRRSVEIVEGYETKSPVQTEVVKLKPARKADGRRIAAALQRGKKAVAKLTVTLADDAGNSTTEKLQVRLKR
jgi:hypothetical protein